MAAAAASARSIAMRFMDLLDERVHVASSGGASTLFLKTNIDPLRERELQVSTGTGDHMQLIGMG
jgi:hypothetical protein